MLRLKSLKRLVRIYRLKPHITLSEYGQATVSNHRVAVGIHSFGGMMSLGLDFDAKEDSGHAQAESYAKTLHHITGLPVLDSRSASNGKGQAWHLAGTD